MQELNAQQNRSHMLSEERFHNKEWDMSNTVHSYETQHSSQHDLLELDLKTRVSQRPDCCENVSKVDLSSSANTKMLRMKLKNKCKNGRQKTHRNDCERL